MPLKLLDPARLTQDWLATVTLPKGLRGTIVHVHSDGGQTSAFEVEFCDDEGRGFLVSLPVSVVEPAVQT
jgi:hypothetical protein